MARTPLLNVLLNLSRERAAAEQSERARNQPGRSAIGRRAVLRGAAGLALTSALPLTGLAATARVAVVGAGLAGLTAVRELRKAGLNPDVYEASTRIGGRCYSARGFFGDGRSRNVAVSSSIPSTRRYARSPRTSASPSMTCWT